MLFFAIIIICFLLTVASDIVKLLRISALFTNHKSGNTELLQEELKKAKAELDKVLNTTGQDRYVAEIRRMRAEDKVNEAQRKIKMEQRKGQLKTYSTEIIMGYGFKAILYISLAIISFKHRYNPVLTFSEDISLQPLQGLLSFPTGVPNAISVPIWVLSCNVTFRLMSGLVRQHLTSK
ncbi:uncharacterized protein LOC133323931 [Musca vetustissima]|uniref:uncharacterized protein LOC133323931 n=1 Tax=Musca vetustissima TaxID=27455 RepID=UPI002AB717BD|nr:uncharacterized protein LOC133323931 [Musca vetustissima]